MAAREDAARLANRSCFTYAPHVIAIARRVRLTRYKSPGWKMAVDITERLKRFDPEDPVKYDFAFHRMGLWKKDAEIDSLR